MTKRPRTEDTETQWPTNLSQTGNRLESVEGAEGSPEGSTGNPLIHQQSDGEAVNGLATVAAAGPTQEEATPVEVVPGEVATAEYDVDDDGSDVDISELGPGEAFWVLLAHAGYSVW